jgi:hypothetical protein
MYSSSGAVTLPTQTNSTSSLHGSTVYGKSTTTGGQTINLSCVTHFEVDQNNQIVSWRYKGNNCSM